MAIGDNADMIRRLQSLIPGGWLARTGVVYNAVFGGLADSLAMVSSLLAAVTAQTRIATASGWFLDLIAWDFFGSRFLRHRGEPDTAWRGRIIKEIFRPRVTRAAIVEAVTDLVGTVPQLFEPWNTGDCGAYDVGTLAYAGSYIAPTFAGYDTPQGGLDMGPLAYADLDTSAAGTSGAFAGAGCYGSYEFPNQFFLKVQRPPSTGTLSAEAAGYGFYDSPNMAYGGGFPGVPEYAGFDSPLAGLDVGTMAYSAPTQTWGEFSGAGSYAPAYFGGSNPISDDEIYATVAATIAAGVTAWVGLDIR